MDDIIHINIGGYEKDGNWVSTQTIRLWPAIIASTRWMLQAPKPQQTIIHKGVAMMAINNLAISIEGFIGDMIYAQLDTNSENQHPVITKLPDVSWDTKRGLYNRYITTKLTSYPEFRSIEVLMLLRNNFLHGLSYTESNQALNAAGTERTKIISHNKKYQKAREYFIGKGLLADTSQMSNSESFWKMQIIGFLLNEVMTIISRILHDNSDNKFLGLKSEWEILSKINYTN
jgi:hypothetical protein